MKPLYKIALITALLTALGSGVSFGQHYVGVRAGFGSGTARVYPEVSYKLGYRTNVDMRSIWGMYSAGVSWKYFTQQKYLGGIEVDLLWMQQGFNAVYQKNTGTGDEEILEDAGYSQRRTNTVMMPIFWQPHIYMFDQRLRVFLNAGVTFSYHLNSTYEECVYPADPEKGKYKFSLTKDNRWGYGLCGGGGFGWSFNRVETVVEARYYIGYSDLLKNKNKNEENEYLRSPLDGLQISFGVYYRLGKGGVLAKRSKRAEARFQQREAEMMRKALERDLLQPEQTPEQDVDVNTGDSTGFETSTDTVPDISQTETVGEQTAEPAPSPAPETE